MGQISTARPEAREKVLKAVLMTWHAPGDARSPIGSSIAEDDDEPRQAEPWQAPPTTSYYTGGDQVGSPLWARAANNAKPITNSSNNDGLGK
jgi:hypothetical protein